MEMNFGMSKKRRQVSTLNKFIISFLLFYIVFSSCTIVMAKVDADLIATTALVRGMPASRYIAENVSSENGETSAESVKKTKKQIETTSKEEKTKEKETTKQKKKKAVVEASEFFSEPQIIGEEYSIKKLSDFDFLVNTFYTVSASTKVYKSDLNPKVLMKKDMRLKQDNSKPQILIYHTHSQEAFADSKANDESMSIVGVGDYLTKLLREQYGYNVIHVRDAFDMATGRLDRHKAYDFARDKIEKVLEKNPSIELCIDLHRDGVDESIHFVTEVNGKKTAKIMFFNGLSRLASVGEIEYLHNPYREDNLALSMQMKMNAEKYFPGFTRKNYLHAYEYNQSLLPKCILIEAGAQTNTYEEEINAMEPLAVLINLTIGDSSANCDQ